MVVVVLMRNAMMAMVGEAPCGWYGGEQNKNGAPFSLNISFGIDPPVLM